MAVEPFTDHGVRHLAVIMDGNGRWAQGRGLSRIEGHKAGAEAVRRVIEASGKFGLTHLTLYAFSTENWRRPKTEVAQLMSLLKDFLDRHLETLVRNKIRLRAIGRIDDLPLIVRKSLEHVMEITAKDFKVDLILALSYGARDEIVRAAARIADLAASGAIRPSDVDEKLFASNLSCPDVPDPDLLIRTSGELRLSNFLLWQLSYSELWFTELLWPDFDESTLAEALLDFKRRKRRFGGV